MCCLVVRVYCSLSHHLSQPSPLFLRSLTWDCFICCCFLQLTDDDAMSVTLWLMCLVRVRQHVQLYSAAGIFEITPPPQSRSHSISLKGSVHVSCYFMVTQYCSTDPGNERTTVWLADVGFFSERTHCCLEYSNTTGILIITGLGFFKITFYLTSLYDVDFFFINYFISKSASSALF